ncbi:MAG: tetratricopeptide repeat protein [candidate division KSB1 bacterium]|nr:tetratricopeptide repeat protein [candidate division KSB1 bacterium]
MRHHHALKLILVGVIVVTFFVPAKAQYSANKLFAFLNETYNRHDSKLSDFLIVELTQLVQTFVDSVPAADASYLLAKVWDEKGKRHEALATAYKTRYLFPDTSVHRKCADLIQGIIAKEKAYRDKQEKLVTILKGTFTDVALVDRYYAYLTFLMELDEANLYDWTLNEAKYFVSRFSTDSRLYTVLQWIADLYAKTDRAREAVVSYLKLSYLYPNNPMLPYAHYHRARLLYTEIGDNQGAIEVCNQIVSAYPASEYASASLFMLGEIKEKKMKDYEGAIAAYRQLVDTYPQYVKSINALLSIGEINSKKLKNYSAAIIAYNEFVDKYRSSPRGVEALEAIGDIYNDNLKDYSKAAEYYAKIAELYPTYDKAADMLLKAGALCEEKMNDYSRAIEYYQVVVDKYPESKKAGDAAKKIAKVKEKAGK